MEAFYEEGNIVLFTGYMGSGKTDIALLFGQYGIYQNCKVITNIHVDETKNLKIVKNDIELFNYLIKFKNHLNIIILDEGGVFASSKRSSKMGAVYLDSFVFLVRKFSGCLYYIVQREKTALATIRDLCTYHIHKIDKKVCNLSFGDYNFRLNNIPKTAIEYETKSIASFTWCLDIDRIFEELSGLTPDKSYKKLASIIKNPEKYYNNKYRETKLKYST